MSNSSDASNVELSQQGSIMIEGPCQCADYWVFNRKMLQFVMPAAWNRTSPKRVPHLLDHVCSLDLSPLKNIRDAEGKLIKMNISPSDAFCEAILTRLRHTLSSSIVKQNFEMKKKKGRFTPY